MIMVKIPDQLSDSGLFSMAITPLFPLRFSLSPDSYPDLVTALNDRLPAEATV